MQTFSQGSGEQATFVVDGVRCKGTAMFLSSLYQNTRGVLAIKTFATERTTVFTFNPELITRDQIREIMETPVPVRDGTTIQVFRCLSVR